MAYDRGRQQLGRFSDAKVEDLAQRALLEPDRAKRAKLYHELQRHLLAADVAAIPVA